MPTNKNALTRYRVLDKCFRDRNHQYDIQKLVEFCSIALSGNENEHNYISKRQVLYDIDYMESEAGYNIELNRYWGYNDKGNRVRCYRYVDTSFSITNIPLSKSDILHIRAAIEILQQFTGMPQFEWIEEVSQKILFDADINSSKIIAFDDNKYLKGIEHLGIFYQAIANHTPLRISYQAFYANSPEEFFLHPYFLKQYNNRWFVFGYEETNKKATWNLALDRICSIQPLNHSYIKNTTVDWNTFFKDIIGVTKPEGEKPIQVVLQFSHLTAMYILTKPLHASQTAKWLDKETLEVSINVIPNIELLRTILSFGENVRVISPETIKQAIHKKIEHMLE